MSGEVELYGRCPVCRQRSLCTAAYCRLIGVMAGYYAAARNWMHWLISWSNPIFDSNRDEASLVKHQRLITAAFETTRIGIE